MKRERHKGAAAVNVATQLNWIDEATGEAKHVGFFASKEDAEERARELHEAVPYGPNDGYYEIVSYHKGYNQAVKERGEFIEALQAIVSLMDKNIHSAYAFIESPEAIAAFKHARDILDKVKK